MTEEQRLSWNKHVEEVFEKLQKELTLEEIAESFFIPAPIGTPAEERRSAIELADSRRTRREKEGNPSLDLNLIALMLRLRDYVESDEYNPQHTFGFFLRQYLEMTYKKAKELAAEIDIHETMMSQLINSHRLPGDEVIIRLELHSNNIIPAENLFRLVQKEREHRRLVNMKQFVKEQSKHVKKLKKAARSAKPIHS